MQTFDEDELADLESALGWIWLEDLMKQDARRKKRLAAEAEAERRKLERSKPYRLSRTEAEQLYAQYSRRVPVVVVKRNA